MDDERFARVELTSPATVEVIDAVQDLVAQLVDETADDLDFTDRMRFETALVEILGNVVEHGVRAAGRGITVHVVVQRADRELLARIDEDGVAVEVDLDSASMSDVENESGRGLAMARALATELTYRRTGGHNCWVIRCECSP